MSIDEFLDTSKLGLEGLGNLLLLCLFVPFALPFFFFGCLVKKFQPLDEEDW